MFLEVDIQFAFAMEFTTSVLDTCSGKYTVQRRNQDECQHSRYRQTTDYGIPPSKLITLSVLPVKNNAIKTPLNANGRENMIMNG